MLTLTDTHCHLDFDQFVVMRPRFVPTVLWGDRSASVSG